MDHIEMQRVFEAHREAEAARDIDAILETFVDDCFLVATRRLLSEEPTPGLEPGTPSSRATWVAASPGLRRP
jgi:hypothetical protein